MGGIKKVLSCPLGHKCQEIINGEVSQCAWFIRLAGINPTTGDQTDEYGCSMSWIPMLLIENSQQQRSTNSSIESFRNEMVTSNNRSQELLLDSLASNKFLETNLIVKR
jgi:hypothetical protein